MALTRTKVWIAGEILTHTDLNAEIDNLINNTNSLQSPWTGNIDAGGFRLIALGAGSLGSPTLQPTGDSNTGVWFSAADTIDVSAGGSRAAQLGASWLLAASPEDSRTDSVDVVGEIRSTTSSAPAAGIGTGVKFTAESADENPSDVGELDFAFSDVSAGSEDSRMDVLLRTAGAALGARWRMQATGAFNGIFTHANTAARTYTFPDNDFTLGAAATKASASLTADFTTTSTTFVNTDNLVITTTTTGGRILMLFSGVLSNSAGSAGSMLTFTVDGTNQGGTNGLAQIETNSADSAENATMIWLTTALSAASHTFRVQIRADSGTAKLRGNPTGSFIVVEI